MSDDRRTPAGSRGIGARRSSEHGFSVLEILVIVVIVCVVVAIGIPVVHARAKASVLSENLQTLAQMVVEQVSDGYSIKYRASGEGDPEVFLSSHLEESLNAMGSAGYVNPMVGSKNGRVVLNSGTVSTNPPPVSPAVLITDSPEYQYQAFDGLAEGIRQKLAGSLVVALDPEVRTVDVFYVTSDGMRSTNVMTFPAG
jgi:competence protein ComGC